MKAIKIKDNIYWVGGIDWDLRNFHGYLTQRGSTYNAYLVIDEKITLIDTVKHYLCDEMLERISSVVDPSKIDCIISNHVEMDHSGSLPMIAKIAPRATIYTSPNGMKGLNEHYKSGLNLKAVNNAETISTGKYNFTFVLTPMVHWPDNMITYLPEERILFSNDAFGQHLATPERFDDEFSLDIIMEEARKYYANIVLPYSDQVKKALAAAAPLAIDVIAPSHGIIWRKNIPSIIKAYTAWSANETADKALIIYDTMWNSTKKIAFACRRGVRKPRLPRTHDEPPDEPHFRHHDRGDRRQVYLRRVAHAEQQHAADRFGLPYLSPRPCAKNKDRARVRLIRLGRPEHKAG